MRILGVYILTLLLTATSAVADMRCSTNAAGITTYKDNQGTVIKASTNAAGTTTYKDNHGKVVRCHTNSAGTTICK